MPAASAASTSPVPFGTSMAMPSIVSVTVSAALMRHTCVRVSYPCLAPVRVRRSPSCGHRGARRVKVHRDRSEHVVERRRVSERTALLLDVRDELRAELLDIARDRDGRGLSQRTEALAVDAVAHVEQQVELGLQCLTRLEPAQDLRHPARPLTARRALAARLVLVELGDPDAELHHAAPIVEHDDTR